MDSLEPQMLPPGTTPHAVPQTRPARRLPRGVQIGVLAVGAGLLVAYFLFSSLFTKTEAPPATPTVTSTSFKPTDAQWAGFKTADVRSTSFSASQTTDGKIAIDDDRTVSVYSPYTGRVSKLFVKAGAEVRAGDPLMAIQATEFVQAANDLVSASGSDRTAKAQLALAVATEKRQHELYLAQGGSLKDWQQSQSDLTNARGTFSGAEGAPAHPRQVRPRDRRHGDGWRPNPVQPRDDRSRTDRWNGHAAAGGSGPEHRIAVE